MYANLEIKAILLFLFVDLLADNFNVVVIKSEKILFLQWSIKALSNFNESTIL
jgi:hypothetical protein